MWAKMLGKPDPYAKLAELNDRSLKTESNVVYALKDISFKVEEGEVLGIVGKNGAGKSTLLKILSQITSPTAGDIRIKGRIASLLEVGTGFHPEMTARQNIYLNGSIMGMTRREIDAKLDEIVDFAGIGKYIDTPTKRVSSGMTVRLGFAIAAFLEPEILIVDEVLAVGDAEFQKKAIGKMQDVTKSGGRTVLFVSHNMAAVKSLCSKAILLENGMIRFEGGVDETIVQYLKLNNEKGSEQLKFFTSDMFKAECTLELFSFGVRAENKDTGELISRADKIIFEVEYLNQAEENKIFLCFKDEQGQFLFVTGSGDLTPLHVKQKARLEIPSLFFNEGNFFVDIQVTNGKKLLFREEDAISFTIVQEKKDMNEWMGKTPGALKPEFNWKNV